jgi:hypothetical protein
MKNRKITLIIIGLLGLPQGMQPVMHEEKSFRQILQNNFAQLRQKLKCVGGSRECTYEEIRNARNQFEILGTLLLTMITVIGLYKISQIEKSKREQKQQKRERKKQEHIETIAHLTEIGASRRREAKEAWQKDYNGYIAKREKGELHFASPMNDRNAWAWFKSKDVIPEDQMYRDSFLDYDENGKVLE